MLKLFLTPALRVGSFDANSQLQSETWTHGKKLCLGIAMLSASVLLSVDFVAKRSSYGVDSGATGDYAKLAFSHEPCL